MGNEQESAAEDVVGMSRKHGAARKRAKASRNPRARTRARRRRDRLEETKKTRRVRSGAAA
jgi:hypothetical protein